MLQLILFVKILTFGEIWVFRFNQYSKSSIKRRGAYSSYKIFQFVEAFISKLNENRTEIMGQNLVTGRIVKNVGEIILFVFFPSRTSKYVYQLSVKTLFLSVFDFLGLRDPYFQEIRYFFCVC